MLSNALVVLGRNRMRGAIFGSKPGKGTSGQKLLFVFVDRKAPILPQPGLSGYYKASVREHANESSRAIKLINDLVSFKR